MRKYRKWIIAGILLILLAVLVYAVGWNTVRLPYFLSGSMEKYLLEIPVGENAKDLILSYCEEISSQVMGKRNTKPIPSTKPPCRAFCLMAAPYIRWNPPITKHIPPYILPTSFPGM